MVAYYENLPIYMWTLVCGNPDKPKLVLVHGYGGSSAFFFKIIKDLCEHFCLILVDVIGMGGSSWPEDFDYDSFSP